MKKEDLKIVFLGTPEFAVESLDRLVTGGYNVAAVVTMPDKPAGRGHKLLHSPVKQYAEAHGIRVLQPVKLRDPQFIDTLREINADLFIVIAFRMLPEVVWSMPPLGTFNLHASLLPKYRGAAPINWAVINGDTRTGVTTFFLQHDIDTGDIIDQTAIDILPDDCVGDVHDKLMHIGADLTLKTVSGIIDGSLSTTPQSLLTDTTAPTPAPKIFKETCHIDWNRNASDIHNLIRGLSPYPAAWTELKRSGSDSDCVTVKVFRTAVGEPCQNIIPGTLRIENSTLCIAAADRWVEILELQAAGKRRMPTADFLRGFAH